MCVWGLQLLGLGKSVPAMILGVLLNLAGTDTPNLQTLLIFKLLLLLLLLLLCVDEVVPGVASVPLNQIDYPSKQNARPFINLSQILNNSISHAVHLHSESNKRDIC